MSSLTRRIQRTTQWSQAVHPFIDKRTQEWDGTYYANAPRKKGYLGRGSKLGFKNPEAKDLLKRLEREEKRRAP